MHFLSIRGAFEFFEKEIDDVLIAAEVFQYRARGSVPVIQEILDSLERLQAARPSAVAVAIAAAELLHDKKLCGWHIGQVGLQSVWKFVDVDVDTLEESFVHPREAVDKFLYECIQPLTIVVRTFASIERDSDACSSAHWASLAIYNSRAMPSIWHRTSLSPNRPTRRTWRR